MYVRLLTLSCSAQVWEREFDHNEPPSECCCSNAKALENVHPSDPSAAGRARQQSTANSRRCPRHSHRSERRLLGSTSAVTQHELLSMCVVACSFLGCVLVGYRHFIK